ncbi:MAG: hypothetical protein WCI27_01915 [Candidatus Omnitrophota bacterium]
MAKKETAEEKLLKIIEASRKAKDVPAPVAPPKKSTSRIPVSLRQINIVLLLIVVAGFIFMIKEVVDGRSRLSEDMRIAVDLPAIQNKEPAAEPRMKEVSWYLNKVSSRNVFQPFEKRVVGEQAVPSDRAALQAKIAKYKFVGVAWLDVPESATVMLENIATKETCFLREGDKIEGIVVKTIYTDRAVFSYANEEITIKL